MSIATELTLLANSKQAIKNSINQKGGSITDSTPFADYSTAIDNLPSGGETGNPLLTSIDVSDFTGTTFNRVQNYITDVTIPSGVAELGYEAFYQCVRLTSITLPNTLNRINERAFMGCSSLQTINIPNTVIEIFSDAFAESGLTSFSMPMGITNSNKIGSALLSNCKNLTSVDFGKINEIKNFMCYGCTSLTAIIIPSTVTFIGASAFQSCTALTSVTIPDSVTIIDISVFEGCTALTSVTIGNGVTRIGAGVFIGCTALASVTVNTTTPPTIASNTFNNTNNCPIYVPASSVDTYKAANNWSTLASRIYPIQQVATVDGNPVYNYEIGNTDSTVITDTERSKIPTGDVLEFSEGLEQIGGQLGAYEEVIMPSTFNSFDDTQPINAATTTLTCKATIPPSVEGSNLGGSGLTAIYVPSAKVDNYKAAAWGWSTFASIIQAIPEVVKPAFKFTSSVDSSKDITVNCEDTATAGTLTTNDLGMSSQQIDEFRSAENTGSVEIGDCVKIYRASNCYTAKGISEVKLNEGLERIEDFAFGGMSALREITIPSTVTNISYQAFYADRALTSITCLADTPPTLGSDVFGDTNNCPIYVPAESVDAYKTAWSQYADRIQAIPAE